MSAKTYLEQETTLYIFKSYKHFTQSEESVLVRKHNIIHSHIVTY